MVRTAELVAVWFDFAELVASISFSTSIVTEDLVDLEAVELGRYIVPLQGKKTLIHTSYLCL